MNQKEQVEVFRDLEKGMRLGQMRVHGFNYWPVIRFAINYQRKYGHPYRDDPLPDPEYVPKSFQEALDARLVALRKLTMPIITAAVRAQLALDIRALQSEMPDFQHSDLAFYVSANKYKGRGKDALYNPFLDGLADILADRYTITLVSQGAPDLAQRPNAAIIPPPNAFGLRRGNRLLRAATKDAYDDRRRVLGTVAKVNKRLSALGAPVTLSEYDILMRIDVVTHNVKIARAWLEKIRPRAVVLTSYSGSYYVCIAARQLNIPVVDIQHGGMHRHHALAANWFNVPRKGYEILPSFFWCWTARSAGYITFGRSRRHKAILGGNPALAVQSLAGPGRHVDYLNALSTDPRPKVVVALQYGKDALLPDHVIAAWRTSQARYRWVFRMHPMAQDRIDELTDMCGITAEEAERAAQVPLTQLLANTDVLLTKSSTIVHEALAFGNRPAVWSEKGRSIFDDLVERGDLVCTEDQSSLLAFLQEATSETHSGPDAKDISLTNPQLCLEAIETILSET